MTPQRFYFMLLLTISMAFLAACQSPCERPIRDGYTRFIPTDGRFEIGFDHPTEWEMKPDRSLQKTDTSGHGLSVLVEFNLEPVERYPHIFDKGHLISNQEWGSPFPGHSMKIESRNTTINGYPGLTVIYDFDTPLTLANGSSPVTSWSYLQFTFVVVNDVIYDIRFYASREEEELIRKEFERLVKSICIYQETGSNDD